MRVKRIISQYRRDFYAVYECEHCGHEEEGTGYDDSFFHDEVIPEKKCAACGKTAGEDYRPLAPKYPEDVVV